MSWSQDQASLKTENCSPGFGIGLEKLGLGLAFLVMANCLPTNSVKIHH